MSKIQIASLKNRGRNRDRDKESERACRRVALGARVRETARTIQINRRRQSNERAIKCRAQGNEIRPMSVTCSTELREAASR